MSTYLKNIAGYKHSQLKSKSYDEIPKLFDKEMKRVNTFVDINSEVVKGSKTRTEESFKRAGDELESDKSKKQKIDKHVEAKKDDDLEEEEIKKHMEIIVPAFLKELICKVLRLLVPLLELNRFGILLGEPEEGQFASSGWPFVSAVPGLVTYLVASLTLDSARSCVMQSALLTQGKASSIPTIFSWGSSISPDSFLPSILLLLVIIVAVVIVVTVILVVVVVEGWANEFHQNKASLVRVPIANFTL
ncbi:hypothetical protein Tco_1503871 [Tanacetum coccineum]